MNTIKCPHCGTEYEVEKQDMYHYTTCEACGKGFVIGATTSVLSSGEIPQKTEAPSRLPKGRFAPRHSQVSGQRAGNAALPGRFAHQGNEESVAHLSDHSSVEQGLLSERRILISYILYVCAMGFGTNLIPALIGGCLGFLMFKCGCSIAALFTAVAAVCIPVGLALNWICYRVIIVKRLYGMSRRKLIAPWILLNGFLCFGCGIINICAVALLGQIMGLIIGLIIGLPLGYCVFRFVVVRMLAGRCVIWEKVVTWGLVCIFTIVWSVLFFREVYGIETYSDPFTRLMYEMNGVNSLMCPIAEYGGEDFMEGMAYPLRLVVDKGSVFPHKGVTCYGHFFKTSEIVFDGDRIDGVWICCGIARFPDKNGLAVTGRAFRRMNDFVASYRIAQIAMIRARREAAEAAERKRLEAERQAEQARRDAEEREERKRRDALASKQSKLNSIKSMVEMLRTNMESINKILCGKKYDGFGSEEVKAVDPSADIALEILANINSGNLSMESDDNDMERKKAELTKEINRVEKKLRTLVDCHKRHKKRCDELAAAEARRREEEEARDLESRKEKCATCSGFGVIACTRCKGSGSVTKNESEVCPACFGDGVVERNIKCNRCGGKGSTTTKCTYCWRPNSATRKKNCTWCGGSGYKSEETCLACLGSGFKRGTVRCGTCGGIGETATYENETCPACSGNGKLRCEHCGGRGFTYRPKLSQPTVPVTSK